MNPKFRQTLLEWKRDGLTPLLPDDFDALLTLHRLAEAITNPAPSADLAAALMPSATAGNATFHRPTIGARWFLHARSAWFEHDPGLEDATAGWVLAHIRDPAMLQKWIATDDRAGFEAEVNTWLASLTATPEDLQRAIRAVTASACADDDLFPPLPRPPPTHDGELRCPVDETVLAIVAAEYGLSVEDIIWNRPEHEVRMLYRAYAARKAIENGKDPHTDRLARAVQAYTATGEQLRKTIIERRRETP